MQLERGELWEAFFFFPQNRLVDRGFKFSSLTHKGSSKSWSLHSSDDEKEEEEVRLQHNSEESLEMMPLGRRLCKPLNILKLWGVETALWVLVGAVSPVFCGRTYPRKKKQEARDEFGAPPGGICVKYHIQS